MIDLVLFVLATIGLTLILIDGKILYPFREWVREKNCAVKNKWFDCNLNDLIVCHQCCGFWAGLLCGLMTILPWGLVVNKLFLFACAGSFASMVGSIVVDYYNALLYVEEEEVK